MAATLTQERFTGPEWTFERKFDGIRLLAFKQGAAVRLLSRNRLPQDAHYPSVAEAVAQLPAKELILDGEATGVWGKQGRVAYHVFDVPWLNGRLAGFKRPRHVYITSEPIPRLSAEAKIARGQIKRELAEWVSTAHAPDHVTKVVQ